jgi:hypothetical protein
LTHLERGSDLLDNTEVLFVFLCFTLAQREKDESGSAGSFGGKLMVENENLLVIRMRKT